MKNLKYITIALAVMIGFSSCEDAYNIEPVGILDEEATFVSVDDAQTYLNGVYGTIQTVNQIGFTSIFTDELAPSVEWNGSNQALHQFVIQSTSGYPTTLWLEGHRAVNRVNRLLNGVENITPETEAEEDRLNDIIAQGRFIRAYAYLTLLSYFSPDMTDNNALGGMLFTDVPASDVTLPRATNGETYQLMEEDLNFAFNNIQDHSFIYPTKAAVEALMARMYAYRGMYGPAYTHAYNVVHNYGISLTPGMPFELNNFYHPKNSTNPYRQIWSNIPVGETEQHEQIFTLQSLVGGSPEFAPAAIFFQNSTRCSGNPLWSMGYNVWNMFHADQEDVRLWAFTDPTSFDNNNPDVLVCNTDEIMIDKYPGLPGAARSNNLVLIRLSEMYFIMAEARAEDNNLGDVATYIRDIRQARSTVGTATLPSYSNAQEAWRDILKERRLEYFAEGYRYVDLKRLRHKANVSIDRNPKDNANANVPLTIPIDDHKWTLPVPFAEIQVNSLIVQNPGY